MGARTVCERITQTDIGLLFYVQPAPESSGAFAFTNAG